ncbi:MAG: TonB-dependent receptor [Sphingobacteriales bacterium]|nr:MAG: TonB-dependent receptor [Sphingobacteriales bacterium]
MLRQYLFALIVLLNFAFQLSAQTLTNVVISGYVKDAESLETLVGASVYVKGTETGTTSNVYGYYSLKVPQSDQILTFVVSYLGYETTEINIVPIADKVIGINLRMQQQILQEVVITDDVVKQRIESTQMGMQKITSQNIKTIPVLFGEADVMKVVQLTAGVQTGSEGSSGIYVRGGGYDQNLILLDEATVYNPEHLFGFFSTFNSDIVKNLEIYKSDFPAQYGGRLSSVLDIQTRDGNMRKFGVQGGIGLIASRLTVEGPMVKDKGSFVVSGRRTYVDLFTPMINRLLPEENPMPDYYFYDLNVKLNYILSDKDRLFVSGYLGRDKLFFRFNNDPTENTNYGLNWGNLTGTVRWNHVYNPSLFSNTTFVASRFNYRDRFNFNDFYEFTSSTETYTFSLKQDYDLYASDAHKLKFGIHFTHHSIRPVDFSAGVTSTDTLYQASQVREKQRYEGEEAAVYLSHIWKLNSRLAIKSGIRLSGFLTVGSQQYFNAEPRVSANYLINDNLSIKAGYSRMAQYLHQVKFINLSFLDPWFPSNKNVRPQTADQVSAGLTASLFQGRVSFTNEYYYKWLHNQLDYRNGADFLFIDANYHERLTVGSGRSYGAEWQLEKTKGNLTGWLSYTLSWAHRRFPDLNNGKEFPFNFDRRHVLTAVIQYQLPRNWLISANFIYRTGEAIDLAVGRFFLYGINFSDPEIVPDYLSQNSFRMPDYHRLDLGFIKRFASKKRFQSELSISFYNVYNRRNAFFIYYDNIRDKENQTLTFKPRQASLFPIIPSISYNFKI